jgi:shikimate kinase
VAFRERDEIVLIGPVGSGKSTQGRLLAARLGLPEVSVDDLRWDYFAEIGYDAALADRIRADEGFLGLYEHWRPFELHALERVLVDHHDCVFSFGAGYTVQEDPELVDRTIAALETFRNVVLLLPSPDDTESVRVLSERRPGSRMPNGFDFHEHFVRHPLNRSIARHVVYTVEHMPEKTCDDILAIVDGNGV